MPIDVQCQKCGKSYRVQDSMAGKKGKCKECGGVLEVPRGIDRLEVSGPTTLQMAQMTGKRCPKCDIPVMDGQMSCDECGTDLRFSGRPIRRSHSHGSGTSPLVVVFVVVVVVGCLGAVAYLLLS